MLAAAMSMEEIFNQRKTFKEKITRNVQNELIQFGLFVYNANIKQLQDTPGCEYFLFTRKKAQEEAVNQAKIDVAEARHRGNVGETERIARTRQQTQHIESETVAYENEKKRAIAESEAALLVKKAELDRQVDIANVESAQAVVLRRTELERQVEEYRLLSETERLRAEVVSKSAAEKESLMESMTADTLISSNLQSRVLWETAAEFCSRMFKKPAAGLAG
ncbi:hypothetical protein CBR_g30848 [Chara braunii]|uniref:Flotillin-like n=1 Tax=Chara braunii TaxID=69332 RepID=A0A388JXK2_CHABU|nr:hypothetical protein CBR_g30848 [Chara braunii]|eukprot:GBG62530.1 hypothetical protein CBR_g30848 [Chara braunii]